MWLRLALVGLALNLARLLLLGGGGGGCPVETLPAVVALPSKLSLVQNELRHHSRMFQQLAAKSQGRCTTSPSTRLVVFSNSTTVLQRAYFSAVLLLESIADKDSQALAVEPSAYFLPLYPCQATQQLAELVDPRVLSNSAKLDLVDQLHLRLGTTTANALTNWQFFIREALRFVTRPSKPLRHAIEGLRYPKPFAEWEPYKYAASRVCIYFPPQKRSKLLARVVKGLEIYVYSHSGIGMEQAILFPGQDGLAGQLAKELNRNGSLSQQDLKQRRVQSHVPISVLSHNTTTNSELSLLAHAFVFAECDVVVADYSQPFPRFVHLLSTAFRYAHNQFPAYYDLSSNHYEEEL